MTIYGFNLTPFNFTPFPLHPIGYLLASLLHFSQPSLQLLTLPSLISSFYVQIVLHLAQQLLHMAPQSCLTNLTLLGTKLKRFKAS